MRLESKLDMENKINNDVTSINKIIWIHKNFAKNHMATIGHHRHILSYRVKQTVKSTASNGEGVIFEVEADVNTTF